METIQIKYKITFLSDWHAGSGLSSGADADEVVIKDDNNLPYLPGKTIKGLLKDVFNDFAEAQPELLQKDFIRNNFGEYIDTEKKSQMGGLFFSNAELNQKEKAMISEETSQFLYRNLASTAIAKNGVAKNSSLRNIQVCIPVVLHGYIDGVHPKDIHHFEAAFKYLRYIGSNRNRGLGRCFCEIIKN
jgi:CRISPR/Cas system CSM-associated protein Csm3 (group 7 of RAMP superfamily)